jgi:hypothetical protein
MITGSQRIMMIQLNFWAKLPKESISWTSYPVNRSFRTLSIEFKHLTEELVRSYKE